MRGRVTLKPISVINDNTHPETYLVPKITTEKAHKDLKQPQKWAKKLIWRNTHSTPKKHPPHPKAPTQKILDGSAATKIPGKTQNNQRTQIQPKKKQKETQ